MEIAVGSGLPAAGVPAPCSPAHGEQAFTASAGAEILFPPTAIGWQLDVGPEMDAAQTHVLDAI